MREGRHRVGSGEGVAVEEGDGVGVGVGAVATTRVTLDPNPCRVAAAGSIDETAPTTPERGALTTTGTRPAADTRAMASCSA